jgi:hypothetical protein
MTDALRVLQTMLDAKHESGFIERDETPVEFGGNTPSGGKFAVPWDMHGTYSITFISLLSKKRN